MSGADSPRVKPATEPWTDDEREFLRQSVIRHGENDWPKVAAEMRGIGRSSDTALRFWRAQFPLVKGAWSKAEDELLISLVDPENLQPWATIAGHVPGRNAKQCRERWVNNLDPTVNKGPWDPSEDALLIAAQSELGNKWSEIAKRIPGRPDNAVKNRWYCMVNRQQWPDGSKGPIVASKEASRATVPEAPAAMAAPGVPVLEEAPRRRSRRSHRRSRSAPDALPFVLDGSQPDMQPRPGAAMAGAGGPEEGAFAASADPFAGLGTTEAEAEQAAYSVPGASAAQSFAAAPSIASPLHTLAGIDDSPAAIKGLFRGIEGLHPKVGAETPWFGVGDIPSAPAALDGSIEQMSKLDTPLYAAPMFPGVPVEVSAQAHMYAMAYAQARSKMIGVPPPQWTTDPSAEPAKDGGNEFFNDYVDTFFQVAAPSGVAPAGEGEGDLSPDSAGGSQSTMADADMMGWAEPSSAELPEEAPPAADDDMAGDDFLFPVAVDAKFHDHSTFDSNGSMVAADDIILHNAEAPAEFLDSLAVGVHGHH